MRVLDRPLNPLREKFGKGSDLLIDARAVQRRQVLLAVFDAHNGPRITTGGKHRVHQKPGDAAIPVRVRVNIPKHPVAENRTNTGLGFMFQEIEQSPHRISDDFPSWRNISRSPQEDGVVSVPSECRWRNQPSSHARLKQFSVPLAVSPSY
jgi:hypothetical protein